MKSLKIIPSYKCDVGCSYCRMNMSNTDEELNIDDTMNFIDCNEPYLNFNSVKLLSGESWRIRNSWIEALLKRFDKVVLVTKLINDDIDRIIDLCKSDRLDVIVSYTSLDNLNTVIPLKKYIDFIDVVLTNDIIDDLYNIVKWSTENYIPIHLTSEVTNDLNQKINDKKLQLVLERIKNDIGLINIMNYTDLAFGQHNKAVEQVTIDPHGDIYTCTMDSGIHGVKRQSNHNIYKSSLSEITHECYTNRNDVCSECRVKCEGSCGKFNGVSFYNVCTLNKLLYNLIPDFPILNTHQAVLTLTYDCTMNCNYCFEKDRNREFDGMMSVDNAINIIKYLNRISVYKDNPVSISLFGGEPTLNMPVIRAVVDFFRDNRVRNISIMVQTNLYILTDEMIELFRELHNSIQTQIVFSLDGDINANVHRLSGDKETFVQVLNNMKYLHDSIPGIDIHLCSVLTSESIDTFEESADLIILLKDSGYISGSSWSHVEEITEGFELSENDIEKLCYIYHKKVKPKIRNRPDYEELISLFGGLRLEMNFGNNISKDYKDYKPFVCNFGVSTIGIMPNGRVLPCFKCINKHYKNMSENYIPNYGFPILSNFENVCMNEEVLMYRDIKCNDCQLSNWCNWCPVVNAITSNHSNTHEQYYKKCMRVKMLAKYNLKYIAEQLELETLELLLDNSKLLDELSSITSKIN